MRAHSLEDLVLLAEGEAVQKHFDARNFAFLRPVLVIFAIVSGILLLVGIIKEDPVRAGVSLANLMLALALFTLRDTDTFAKYFRHILLLYLLLQLLLLVLPIHNAATAVAVA